MSINRDKNNPFSLRKYEAVREKLVFISCKTWKNYKHVSCSRAELPQEAYAVSLSTRKRVQRINFGRATYLFTTFFMVEQPRNIISDLQFKKSHFAVNIPVFEHGLQEKCVSGSSHPSEATRWIEEVEMATSVDDPKTARSILDDHSRTSKPLMRGLPQR